MLSKSIVFVLLLLVGQQICFAEDPEKKIQTPARQEELLMLDNGTVKIGINRAMGASITWLSWADYPKNMINSVDPGDLFSNLTTQERGLIDRRKGRVVRGVLGHGIRSKEAVLAHGLA